MHRLVLVRFLVHRLVLVLFLLHGLAMLLLSLVLIVWPRLLFLLLLLLLLLCLHLLLDFCRVDGRGHHLLWLVLLSPHP